MTYQEALQLSKDGKLIKLPNFEGLFKWDYNKLKLIFRNKDYTCDAEYFDILNRTDFYYIL